MIYMSEDTYQHLRDEYSGICMACWTVRHGDTEPDAENYECEECEKERVQGIDNLLIMGLISFEIEPGKAPFVRLKSRKTGEISERIISI